MCIQKPCTNEFVTLMEIATRTAVYQAGYCWSQCLYAQKDGDGKVPQEGLGRLCGATFLRPVKYAESFCVVIAPRAAAQTASARKLR
jgi:hypothetical protein